MLANLSYSTAWPKRQLGDLLTRIVKPLKVESNAEYREIGIRSHCKGIFHKSLVTGKQLGSKRVFWVEPGCLVLNIVFAWEQAVAVTSENEWGMIASHRFPMYQSIDGKLLPEYACLYFSSPRGKYDLGLASPGGAGRNKTLGQEEFMRLKMPVPPPEYQQFAIRAIRTWDTAIAQTEKLIEAKRKLKKGLMHQLLTGKRRFPGFKDKWQMMSVKDLCTYIGSGGTPSTSVPEYWSGIIPWITGADFTERGIGVVRRYITDEAVQSSATRVCPKESILLVSRTGVGKIALAPFNVAISQDITVLELTPNLAEPLFILFALDMSLPRLQRFNQGTSINGVMRKDLICHRILVPSLQEQRKIAIVLRAMDSEIDSLTSCVEQLKEQKRGLMQKLLTGQIRVKAAEEIKAS
jgi:type I restriction enzyme S subunit